MSTKTIMVVDDSEAVRRAVRLMLSAEHFRSIEAPDGKKALELLASEKVDIVLTDLNMPVMDGHSFIARMRERPELRFIPVLVLTTMCSADVVSDLKRAGVTGVLQKPIEREALLKAIDRCLK